jgi:outer membrane protein assembly factor BamB
LTLLAVCAVFPAIGAQAETVALNPGLGPPTTAVAVSGTKFGANEGVDVYFDTTDLLLVVTNGTGSFSQTLAVLAGAQPGTHWVTAVGRKSGLIAQTPFLVRTNWAQFRNGVLHRGFNPFENVLYSYNVTGLNQAWAATTGTLIDSSPAVANGVVYVGSEDGDLYAFDAIAGTFLWAAATGSSISSSPAVSDGTVYVGSEDDNLYAYNLEASLSPLAAALAARRAASAKAPDPSSLIPDYSLRPKP